MKKYGIGLQKKNEAGEIVIEYCKEIREEDVESFFGKFDFLGAITPPTIAYDIVIGNARLFLSFMNQDNLKQLVFEQKIGVEKVANEANRLVFNLCASLESFVEYAKIAVKRLGDDKQSPFESFISTIFDDTLAYRFFVKLRNYTIHYSFPFSCVKTSEPGIVSVICERDNLLKFSGWARVKNDLTEMDDEIDLCSFISPLLVSLTVIKLTMYYYFANNFVDANNAYADLCKDSNCDTPIILVMEDNNLHLRPIPIKQVIDGIEILKYHPRINIIT